MGGRKKIGNDEEIKERILTAAERIFGEKGYEDAKVVEISKEAGVSAKVIYKYFGSKKNLFFSVRELVANRLINEAFSRILKDISKKDLITQMEDLALSFRNYLLKNRSLARILLEGSSEDSDPDIKENYRDLKKVSMQYFVQECFGSGGEKNGQNHRQKENILPFLLSILTIMALALLLNLDRKGGFDSKFLIERFIEFVKTI